MKHSKFLIDDWVGEILAIEKVKHLQQEILQPPSRTSQPCEALALAYKMLADEQKIAFILAGGTASLSQWQQYFIQRMRTGSKRETGQLPVLC